MGYDSFLKTLTHFAHFLRNISFSRCEVMQACYLANGYGHEQLRA